MFKKKISGKLISLGFSQIDQKQKNPPKIKKIKINKDCKLEWPLQKENQVNIMWETFSHYLLSYHEP